MKVLPMSYTKTRTIESSKTKPIKKKTRQNKTHDGSL